MEKTVFTLLMALLVATATFAQDKDASIKGLVQTEQAKGIDAATVALLAGKDSAIIKYAAADASGRFIFAPLPPGTYLVMSSAAGFEKKYSELIVLASGARYEVRPMQLSPATKALSGVTVTAKKPLIEQKIDRTVVNVEASVTNAGSNALEVLEKAPGITIDKDGNISLKGKEGVLVLVDGRPTQLGAADLANLLRSMNASALDQVEIMTNPPAKYDAAGNAGIINIKTKKTKQAGYSGSFSLNYGQGRYPKYNESLNLNYRSGKWNLFTNLSHSHRQNFNRLNIQRNLSNEDSKVLEYYFNQLGRMNGSGTSYNAKVGADYSIGKKTTIGAVAGGLTNPGRFRMENTTFISDGVGNLLEVTESRSTSSSRFRNFSGNLNFRHQFDSTGRELTADVDYITYTSLEQQNLANYYNNAWGNTLRKSDTLYTYLPQHINIWSAKTDYLQPLKGGARFEAGFKSSIVKTDNDARFDTAFNGRIVMDRGRSNHFVYTENINAAYANISGPLSKKWNGQLGLRAEHTYSVGNQLTSGVKTPRNYVSLFPTAFVQYAVNEKNNLGLNYGRRIRRPNYESLNPFVEYLDRYTFQQGNPDLKPQFSHNIELSHSYRNAVTTTLNYTRTTDILQQVIEQNTAKKETYVRQANIAKQRQLGLSVNASLPVTKWWTSTVYVSGSHNRFAGVVDSTPVVLDAKMMMLNGSQQFKFAKTWTAELSGFFRTGGLEGVIFTKPVGALNVGVGKQIMKTKGSVRMTVRDVLWSQKFRAFSRYGLVDAAFQEWRDSRVVNVSFTYRFSKGAQANGSKRRSGSASDEQDRVGGGN